MPWARSKANQRLTRAERRRSCLSEALVGNRTARRSRLRNPLMANSPRLIASSKAPAHRTPFLGLISSALRSTKNLKIFALIDSGFDPQTSPILVIHLQGVALDPVLDANAFWPKLHISDHLTRKVAIATQRDVAPQEAKHVAAAETQQRMLD